jgi:iron(III) transport system ATP-binding protein
MPTLLEVNNLSIQYPNQERSVVKNLSFALEQGNIACLLGPSGCGKTSVLRAISGFLQPTAGEVWIKNQLASSPTYNLSPEKRGVGVVFQDYALFPHLSVEKNIAFGIRHAPKDQMRQRVNELLDLVGLKAFAQQFPNALSGGQQQRVALARALAPSPALILLDEPFSNLDIALKEKLSYEVRDILKSTNSTAILVTHDQFEAFAISDIIGVFHQGHLAQWADPYRLYHEPASRAVADFIGQGVFVEGQLTDQGVEIELGQLKKPADIDKPLGKHGTVEVLLRPDDIIHDDNSPLQARVKRKSFRGADFLYTLETDNGQEILALVPSHHNHAIGEKIGIRLDADHVVAFPKYPLL